MTRLLIAAGLLACLMGGAVQAQPQIRVTPGSSEQIKLSFAPVVKAVTPSVVNVYGSRVERRQNAAMDEFMRRFFGDQGGPMPNERTQRSLGSGVIVDPSGLVVTNYHVIDGMTEVKVSLSDRREFEAEILLRDPRTDLAILKLKGAGPFHALELGNSDALQVGDLVLAVGNPFGVGQTVTQGIVSALARTQIGVSDYQFFIQTDAAINPGNSGGPLVDMDGRVVGINSAIYSRSGGSIGIGFAIPASMVKAVVESAKMGSKTVRRPWIGASLQAINRDIADSLGLERPEGVLVSSVFEKGPAAAAGIRRGDIILQVDGQEVDDPEAFGYRFALKGITGEAPVTLLRDGKRLTLQVKLMPPPETRPRETLKISARSPLSGATIMNMSPAVADELQVEISDEGIAIADVDENSIAAQVGFRKGDVILAIDRDKVTSTRELDRIMRRGGQVWQITLRRAGRVITTVVGG